MVSTFPVTDHDDAAAGPAPAAALRVVGLVKSYDHGRVPVLQGVDLEVAAGARVAVVGANGSGKSTLLRCCLPLHRPDGGRVWHGKKEITALRGGHLRRARARVGFVFQRHNLQPRLAVLSNVIHGALGRGGGLRAWRHWSARRIDREEAMAQLDRVGLAHLAERRAADLSGGQSQRVAIARALMQRPAMLLADEPAASLDPAAGEEIMALFARLATESGITLVYVTHDLEHACRYAERVVGLRDGIVALDRPANRVAASDLRVFFDSAPADPPPPERRKAS